MQVINLLVYPNAALVLIYAHAPVAHDVTAVSYTHLDVARTVKRLGSEPIVVYRRTRDRAPAHAFEIQEAIEEIGRAHV